MAREFKLSTGGITVAGATTLLFVNPKAAPNFNLEFLRFWCGQTGPTTSSMQRVQIETQPTAFPTLTSLTPVNTKKADPNVSIIAGGTAGAAGTSGSNASAEGAGTKVAEHDDTFNVLNGWLHVPGPRETVIMPASFASGLGLFLPAAPTVLTGWAYGLIFAEV